MIQDRKDLFFGRLIKEVATEYDVVDITSKGDFH
jgi:hypothetical protein